MASVFEPSSIKVLLANTLPNKTHRQKFSEGWDKEVRPLFFGIILDFHAHMATFFHLGGG